MWQVKLLIALVIIIAYVLVIKRIKADFKMMREANSDVDFNEDLYDLNEDSDNVSNEHTDEKSIKEVTPYDVFPGMVRLFNVSNDIKPLPTFSINENYLKEMSLSTTKINQPNNLKEKFESMPVINLDAQDDNHDALNETKSMLKLPRKRKQQATQPGGNESNKATTEIPMTTLNVDEITTETLVGLELCHEESFEVESSVSTQIPSVNSSISPELQEMLLLAACEEEECFV